MQTSCYIIMSSLSCNVLLMHTSDPLNVGVYQQQSEQKLCLILSFDAERKP